MNRKREQGGLLFSAGQLFGPLLKVVDNPDSYDSDEKAKIFARFFHDRQAFIEKSRVFCTSEAGHSYTVEHSRISYALTTIESQAAFGNISQAALFAMIRAASDTVTTMIQSIPVPVESAIFLAQSPFSTYCFIRDVCLTARNTIIWIDRYFDRTLFHRYLSDVPSSVKITLVTLPVAKASGKADQRRIADFLDVSKLFAAERGPSGYRLVTHEDFHDRWLQVDSKLFALGGSAKDLEQSFTVSSITANDDNLKHVQDLVVAGVEVFGPNQTVHP